MQQILNYTPKVERIYHQYQIQGEINKTLLQEDFYEKSEELKDKVGELEKSSDKLVDPDKKEGSASYHNFSQKKKKKEEKVKDEIYLKTKVDIKV